MSSATEPSLSTYASSARRFNAGSTATTRLSRTGTDVRATNVASPSSSLKLKGMQRHEPSTWHRATGLSTHAPATAVFCPRDDTTRSPASTTDEDDAAARARGLATSKVASAVTFGVAVVTWKPVLLRRKGSRASAQSGRYSQTVSTSKCLLTSSRARKNDELLFNDDRDDERAATMARVSGRQDAVSEADHLPRQTKREPWPWGFARRTRRWRAPEPSGGGGSYNSKTSVTEYAWCGARSGVTSAVFVQAHTMKPASRAESSFAHTKSSA
mmetsp:Transcript_11510/g.34432  ORF Transcript_11510/g.34432 Transcript_11510/m.34432 type:complete len:271 (-) Transcript_11510:129-941(-)